MGFSRKTKMAALVMATILMLTACTADSQKVKEDINKLGKSFQDLFEQATGNETTQEQVVETEATIVEPSSAPEETEIIEEVEETEVTVEETTPAPTATPSPTPAPTATPTPEPTPEVISRVDFSELTDTSIIEGFVVEEEDFSESYGTDEETFVSFSGERLLVSMPDNEIPATSVNLLLNSFYQEALGTYNRYCDEAMAQYELEEVVEDIVSVEVHYTYAANERIIAVRMEYTLTVNDEETKVTEIEIFDMYTASRITNYDITNDVDEFEKNLLGKFGDLKLKSYDQIVLIPDSEDEYIIWLLDGEDFYKEHISIEEISTLFNRYGGLVYSAD